MKAILATAALAVMFFQVAARPGAKRGDTGEPECIKDKSCILVDDMYLPNPDAIGGLSAVVNRAWPDGVMPYVIDDYFVNIPSAFAVINKAIASLNNYTCITLRPKVSTDLDWIHYQPHPQGTNTCNSPVGYYGPGNGKQAINLGGGSADSYCLKSNAGSIMHETMHSIGFMHEQTRDDRDDFVKLNWDNIKPSSEVNYAKASQFFGEEFSGYGEPFDYESVMQYSPYQGSVNGLPTMEAIPGSGGVGDPAKMGQRDHLTESDVKGINNKYAGSSGCAKVIPLP